MTLEEIKETAETWFEWPDDRRKYVTYTSAMLFARDMQKAERERIKKIIYEATDGGWGNYELLIERIG